MDRRDFLARSITLGAGILLPGALGGCEGTESGPPDAGHEMVDGGPPPPPFRGISKGPYVQLLAPGSARLRFESRVDEPFAVRLERTAGATTPDATRAPMTLTYARDPLGRPDGLPDEAGLHVLHEVLLETLEPGEEVTWIVTPAEGDAVTGSFRAPVAPDTAFRLGWLADTMFPQADESVTTLAAQAPDLVLHGGDITYQANPFDTWNRMMHGMAPAFRTAPSHFCVGNHEFESDDEIVVQYERLFAGQGDAGGTSRYFALTYGCARILCIDTESGDLRTMDEPQIAWLDAELAAASADPDVRSIIVGFHRPTYTLSRHAPGDTGVRDLLHSRFVAHGVRLVLMGHAHSYERFVVDGVNYVVDGGGGALLYDPEEERAEVEAARPGEPDLRVAVSMSHGVTVVDVAPDGALSLRRVAAAGGAVQDEVEIAP